MADEVQVRVWRTPEAHDLPLPRYASAGAAGLDLRACVEEPLVLRPLERVVVPTGFCVEIPPGYEGQVRPRSGWAAEFGLTVLNAPGTIDSDYRGEIRVVLVLLGQEPVTIRRGDRVAQLVVGPVSRCELVEGELSSSVRGEGGLGHTGVG